MSNEIYDYEAHDVPAQRVLVMVSSSAEAEQRVMSITDSLYDTMRSIFEYGNDLCAMRKLMSSEKKSRVTEGELIIRTLLHVKADEYQEWRFHVEYQEARKREAYKVLIRALEFCECLSLIDAMSDREQYKNELRELIDTYVKAKIVSEDCGEDAVLDMAKLRETDTISVAMDPASITVQKEY